MEKKKLSLSIFSNPKNIIAATNIGRQSFFSFKRNLFLSLENLSFVLDIELLNIKMRQPVPQKYYSRALELKTIGPPKR